MPGRMLKGGHEHGMPSAWGETAAKAGHDTGVSCNPALGAEDNVCAAGETCSYFDMNLAAPLMTFDSVGTAFIILLQAITFDDWATSM